MEVSQTGGDVAQSPLSSLLALIVLTRSLLVSTSSRHGIRRETPQHTLSSSLAPALSPYIVDQGLDTEGAPEPRASFPRA